MNYRKTITVVADSGVVVREAYFLNNRPHRDSNDGPALILRDDDGTVGLEEYRWDGRYHRTAGPARIEYSSTGIATLEMYYRHGRLHRDPKQGPARIERRSNGFVRLESYYVHGRSFRDPEDGPYHVLFHDNGEVDLIFFSDPPRRPQRKLAPGAKTPEP